MKEINISPADTYIVINKSIIYAEDRTILTMLYQPIIGPLPIILYLSLWSDLDQKENISTYYPHHHLISNMKISLHDIVEARHKLEAIGLLKTFYKEDTSSYIYQLYSPIKAHDFFNHPILNIVLYNNIGKKEYEHLKEYFKVPRLSTTNYKDITASFNDIFTPVPLNKNIQSIDDIKKRTTRKLELTSNFDFSFLSDSLPSSLDSDKIFTKEVKELILQLSYLYELDAIKMLDIIPICLTERGTINKDELRKTCRNFYQFDNNGQLPSVIYREQPEYLKENPTSTSKRDKMIYTFENISPYDLLKNKNKGIEPTTRDLKLAEDLIITYGLKPGVANVLIDYVLKTNNNKLTRNLVETIAGQWQRLNIETVDEAMRIAEKEHKKYKKKSTTSVKQKITNGEKIPEWFDKKIEKQTASSSELEAMQDLLKEYR